jgi:hypothetical protein
MRSRFTNFIPLSLLLLVYLQLVTATATNYTIDDTYGDLRTGQKVVYKPSDLWGTQTCTGCAILPDPSQMMNGTYHEATWNPGDSQLSMSINFSGELYITLIIYLILIYILLGTAIFVFFTLVDNIALYLPTVTTTTAVNFTLDKIPFGQFKYSPQRREKFLFQSLVFAQDGLVDGNHTLVIFGPPKSGPGIYVNFDYAVYT